MLREVKLFRRKIWKIKLSWHVSIVGSKFNRWRAGSFRHFFIYWTYFLYLILREVKLFRENTWSLTLCPQFQISYAKAPKQFPTHAVRSYAKDFSNNVSMVIVIITQILHFSFKSYTPTTNIISISIRHQKKIHG